MTQLSPTTGKDTCWDGPPGPRTGGHSEDGGVVLALHAGPETCCPALTRPGKSPISQRWVPLEVKGLALPRSLSSLIFTGQCGGVARRSPGLSRPVSSLAPE